MGMQPNAAAHHLSAKGKTSHSITFPYTTSSKSLRDGIHNSVDENRLVFVLGAVPGPERVLGRGRTTQLGRSRVE